MYSDLDEYTYHKFVEVLADSNVQGVGRRRAVDCPTVEKLHDIRVRISKGNLQASSYLATGVHAALTASHGKERKGQGRGKGRTRQKPERSKQWQSCRRQRQSGSHSSRLSHLFHASNRDQGICSCFQSNLRMENHCPRLHRCIGCGAENRKPDGSGRLAATAQSSNSFRLACRLHYFEPLSIPLQVSTEVKPQPDCLAVVLFFSKTIRISTMRINFVLCFSTLLFYNKLKIFCQLSSRSCPSAHCHHMRSSQIYHSYSVSTISRLPHRVHFLFW